MHGHPTRRDNARRADDPQRRNASRVGGVYLWHRRLGLAAGALVLVLVATGLALNHGAALALKDLRVTNDWVLSFYRPEPKTPPVSYPAGGAWLTWLEGGLYLDGRPIAEGTAAPKGALALGDLIAVGTGDELLLFTLRGKLVERLSDAGLPGPIEAMGRSRDGQVVLQTPRGRFSSDADFSTWRTTETDAAWSSPAAAPQAVRNEVLAAYRGRGVPLERLLLDIHTGRIVGPWGPYLMDAAALCLLVLLGTGIYNWLRGRP